MKKEENIPLKFNSLSEVHRAFGLPKPLHPLISLIDNSSNLIEVNRPLHSHVLSFYKISYKEKLGGKIKYGQDYYDFEEGGLLFASPNQVIGSNNDTSNEECSLYTLLIHPDFFLSYSLSNKIKNYGFFSYDIKEALHLSEKEKTVIISIFKILGEELNNRIDDFSQDVIISQIELLLNYSNRFYKRQFITRKSINHDLLKKFEEILEEYFTSNHSLNKGIPTVHFIAGKINMSSRYLSDMLRSLTGQSAQQLIHHKLIEKAKEKLSTTNLSVGQVAFELGFEHPQSFSKLFKTKTKQSPLEFRQSFN